MWRTLQEFADWFLSAPILAMRPPRAAVFDYETSGGLVHTQILYRKERHQVELISCTGAGYFPEHSHPNVESLEVFIAGDINFSLRGHELLSLEKLDTLDDDGYQRCFGLRVRVPAGMRHGARVGSSGGMFLSIQHWLNGEPTSVGLDWQGESHRNIEHGAGLGA
jgi:hypothetical protein